MSNRRITPSAQEVIDSQVITRNRISTINFNLRSISISASSTPSNAYPNARLVATTAVADISVTGTLVSAILTVSFKGNTGGDTTYVAAMIDPPVVTTENVAVANTTNVLVAIPYNLDTDQVLKERLDFSPYAGMRLTPGTRIGVVAAGGGTATVFFNFNLVYINELGRLNQ